MYSQTYTQQVILSVIGVPGALLAGWMVELPLLGRRGTLAISTRTWISSLLLIFNLITTTPSNLSSHRRLHPRLHHRPILQFFARMELCIQFYEQCNVRRFIRDHSRVIPYEGSRDWKRHYCHCKSYLWNYGMSGTPTTLTTG